MLKKHAVEVTGGLTQTSKMPCKSYSLPTIACRTGFAMAKIAGSICSSCYANKGFYSMYAGTIEPAQHSRLESLNDPLWVDAMVALIGTDAYFRWHDSGDIQDVSHLELIAEVCDRTPNTRHWLPTREYGMVRAFLASRDIPVNLTIRLSAMYPDKPVIVPASLQGIKGITVSNVHTAKPVGQECEANKRGGVCGSCRACWTDVAVSYRLH